MLFMQSTFHHKRHQSLHTAMETKWRYFPFLLSFLFIGGIVNLFLAGMEPDKWGLPKGIFSAREWKWDDVDELIEYEPNMDGELFDYQESTALTDTEDNSAPPNVAFSASSIGTYIAKGGQDSTVDIVMWTASTFKGHRIKRLKDIVKAMKGNICFEGCSISVTGNQSEVEDADAIVFFMFTDGFTIEALPVRANWDQIWIYKQHEPPTHYSPGAHLNGIFNWTMTYREDSDVYQPYYRMFPLDSENKPKSPLYFDNRVYNSSDWIGGKTGLATAAISNCQADSKRLPILKKLQSSGFPIDIFGRCGNRTVYASHTKAAFWADVSRKYWFYFAVENSLCSDYVTEKFWRTLGLGMVPIVMGRARYWEIAPPKSFIDLRDFSTPNELQGYLEWLTMNPEEYLKFFEWRKHFRLQMTTDDFCDLCAKLKEHKKMAQQDASTHVNSGASQHSVYINLTGWWGSAPEEPNEPACISPEAFGLKPYLG